MSDVVTGWHFTAGMKLRDGTPLVVGRTYRLPQRVEPVMCEVGYHCSARLMDALRYAPGSMLSRVEVGGTVLRESDKCCASERTVLWTLDCEPILHEAGCVFAERALTREREAGREPDARSWAAIAVKRRWLEGLATDAELSAARAAAWDAAGEAAGEAARAAARDAAWEAARDAAWEAAWEAARAAARAAARDAARAAETSWQDEYLVRTVNQAHEEGR